MAEKAEEYGKEAHAQHMDERKGLIDAARESSRTFDQAILAFGAAVFGASVAFLKDVAPNPQIYTIKWLCVSWFAFIVGLLAVILSFLFSHRACLFRIEESEHLLRNRDAEPLKNRWATWTGWCNYLCVFFLFVGVTAWTVFALENLATPGEKIEQSSGSNVGYSKKGLRSAKDSSTAAAPTNSVNAGASAPQPAKK